MTKEFASEQISATRRDELLSRHAQYFADELQHLAQNMLGPEAPKVRERVRIDLQNFRATWQRLAIDGAAERTMSIAEQTFYLCAVGGVFAEALSLF